MPWEKFKSNDGIYLVNWEGITRIIRSSARAKAMNRLSKEVLSEKHWIGPDLYSVEVDWPGVRNETTMQTEMELRKFYAGAQLSMRSQLNALVSMIETTEDDNDTMQDKMAAAQHKTMENVERSVHKGEIGVEVSTFLRDASAETIVVGAAALSGGAALAAMGGGSVMKGAFKYQDTGNVGNAVGTFSTTLLFAACDAKVAGAIGKMASESGRLGMKIVWAKAKGFLEIPKQMIEGKHLNDAASAGLVKAASATPVEVIKSFFDEKWAVPVDVAVTYVQDRAAELLAKSGEKTENKKPRAHIPPVHRSHHLMDSVIYDRSIIDTTAVKKVGSGARG